MLENSVRKNVLVNLPAFFAILAILFPVLVLFGLASFVAEQRTKEIGIRKVVGASVFNLWRLLIKRFCDAWLLFPASLLVPVAYYFMNEWLQKYQYRTQIYPGGFLLQQVAVHC